MTIQKKLIEVAAKLGKISKDAENPHERWSYVSIDEYYAKVASAAINAGVSWHVEEESFEFVESVETICKARYTFTVYNNEDDQTIFMGPLTVVHPYEGAQTTGKMVSYAEQIFMRQLLKVVTGEPDADATAPSKDIKGKADREKMAALASARKAITEPVPFTPAVKTKKDKEPSKQEEITLDDAIPVEIVTGKTEEQYVAELLDKMEACQKRADLMKMWDAESAAIKGLSEEGFAYVREEFRKSEKRLTDGNKA